MNQVSLVGRISKAPQLRYTGEGKAYLNFTLAVENDFYDKVAKKNGVDFIDCVLWGTQAENSAPYMLTGLLMSVAGQLRVSTVDRDGSKFTRMVVRVDSKKFLETKKTVESRSSRPVQA